MDPGENGFRPPLAPLWLRFAGEGPEVGSCRGAGRDGASIPQAPPSEADPVGRLGWNPVWTGAGREGALGCDTTPFAGLTDRDAASPKAAIGVTDSLSEATDMASMKLPCCALAPAGSPTCA